MRNVNFTKQLAKIETSKDLSGRHSYGKMKGKDRGGLVPPLFCAKRWEVRSTILHAKEKCKALLYRKKFKRKKS